MINKHQLASSFQRFLPKESVTAASGPSTKLTAKLSHPTDGTCPYCSKAMTRTNCCGQEVYICTDDRAVFPLPDDLITTQQPTVEPIFPI